MPFEYSIVRLSWAFTCALEAVMIVWPGATQDYLLAGSPDTRALAENLIHAGGGADAWVRPTLSAIAAGVALVREGNAVEDAENLCHLGKLPPERDRALGRWPVPRPLVG